MKRFIDKNGEVFMLMNETTFDLCVIRTMIRLSECNSAITEDYMRELCGRIFGRYPNERPPEVQKRIMKSIDRLAEKMKGEEE